MTGNAQFRAGSDGARGTVAGACHAEHTTGFTGKRLGRNTEHGAWEPCPAESGAPRPLLADRTYRLGAEHYACGEKCSAECPAPVFDDEEFYDGHLDYDGDDQ